MNIGEELVSSYLEYIKGCEFVQNNLYTKESQGEIDVVGIDLHTKTVYICEVAIHLQTGLQYVKNSKPNNVQKLVDKFSKDIEYGRKYFEGYTQEYMLWTPIIKIQKEDTVNNQERDLQEINRIINEKYNVEIEFVINEKFYKCINELKAYAKNETKDIKSDVLRLFQIEEHTKRHVEKLGRKVV